MKYTCLILTIVFIMSACHRKESTPKNVVAKVYEYVLTKDDLKKSLPQFTSIVDSLKVTEEYIEKWTKQKLLYRNALVNIDNTKDLDRLVKKYKEELYVSYYKNALINKKMDTLVFEREIDSFYKNNKSYFKLNETLVKFRYIHVDKGSKEKRRIKKLFKSEASEDKQKIMSKYSEYQDYYFNDSTWVSLKDVYNRKLDFPILSVVDLSQLNKLVTKQGVDRSVYYMFFKEALKKGNIAPLEYVKPTIKNILLHKNKMRFFDEMEQILIKDAVKQKKYEVY